jgi:hypothetical protein
MLVKKIPFPKNVISMAKKETKNENFGFEDEL